MKILADAHIPYLKGVAEQIGETEYLPGNEFSKEAIKDKDALIVRTVTRFDENNLSGSNVKIICSATIGFDHIDTEYCDANDIAWKTAPGCNANSVEQYITSSLLVLARRYDIELKDKTIGIIGVGNVGSKVEKACKKLGMRVLLNDPPREEKEQNLGATDFVDLATIQKESDFITIHTPLTKTGEYATYHLIDENFLRGCKKKPFIMNAARGAVSDNQALKHGIKEGLIAGVVIDCWENEPNIDRELLDMADIATPHIAGYSADGKWKGTEMSINNLVDYYNLDIVPKFNVLPNPSDPVIDLDGIDEKEQLARAVLHTYNPVKESDALKEHPEDFYWFRSNYPLRREYKAFEVRNGSLDVMKVLVDLGFVSGTF
ncbi:MAG: 4-phosphoerythronate dehydrogenase PdxB [Fermentimonas sp.]|jgi:erythronate-4-phosphate dehydrogenase